jgi:hypothetical protein
MSYQGQATERVPTPAGLTEAGVSMNQRLREVRDRISKIADGVHGMTLKSAESAGKPEAPPTNSLRRNLDVGFNFIDQIEAELSRLEMNL